MLGLIPKLRDLVGESDPANFVIFGSAAIALNGVDLKREINDLDVFVSEQTFKNLETRFELKHKSGKDDEPPVPFYAPAEKIEILKSFPGVLFEDVRLKAKPLAACGEFPVGQLADLKLWKTEQARPKDMDDLKAIAAYEANL